MRLSTIISMAGTFLLLGIGAAVAAALLFCFGYSVVYRKWMKGQKRIRPAQLLWGGVLVCYLVVVFGATMMSRGNSYESLGWQPLFSSYRAAWEQFSGTLWRNLILNILLFVPLGFLLPLGIGWFRKCYRTYLAGLVLTLGIEGLQFLLGRGVCEMDDVLNNTLGAMIGYGCYALWVLVTQRVRRRRTMEREGRVGSVRRVLALQLPLLGTLLAFGLIFGIYQAKELGNLTLSGEGYAADRDNVQIAFEKTYSSEKGKGAVYRANILTKEETRQLAETFFSGMGKQLDEGQADEYEETIIYKSEDGCDLWIDYLGGTLEYTDFDALFGEDGSEGLSAVQGASEEEIRRALENCGILPPEGAVFAEGEDGTYSFTAEDLVEDGVFFTGVLTCQYCEGGVLANISDRIVRAETYKTYPLLSEQEAYERVRDGRYAVNAWEYADMEDADEGDVKLVYRRDSKGFYQPVYAFAAEQNDQPVSLLVPALE